MKLTVEQEEKEQRKFEKHCRETYGFEFSLEKDDFGVYEYGRAHHFFEVWLACRENIEVKLCVKVCGFSKNDPFAKGYQEAIDDIRMIIKSQGFKVVTK